jgi:hypothetical protein
VVGVDFEHLVEGFDRLVVLRDLEVGGGQLEVLVVVLLGRVLDRLLERLDRLVVLAELLVGEAEEVVGV